MSKDLQGKDLHFCAKRAVECRRWRWMGGMRVLFPSGWAEPRSVRVPDFEPNGGYFYTAGLPDLSDPATVGCLIQIVREAWPAAPATTSRHASWTEEQGHYYFWVVSFCTGSSWHQAQGWSEADALVRALEYSDGWVSRDGN